MPASRRATSRTSAHRHHHGLGRPLDPCHRGGGRHRPQQGSEARRPFRGAEGHASTPLGHAGDVVQDQGRELFDLVRLRDVEPLHRHAAEIIQGGRRTSSSRGGCEELDWTLSVLFDAMGAMSSKYNDTPARASRAYDAGRDGFVIAGGAGVVVLEEYEHAKARGARIYGEIAGYGATSDGYDMVAPSGEGAIRLHEAGDRRPEGREDRLHQPACDLDPVGDDKEIEAIREVFGNGDACPPIAGHEVAHRPFPRATGVQEAIYSLLMMNNGFICESAQSTRSTPPSPTCRSSPRPPRRGEARPRPVELLRLRRYQRDAGPEAYRRLTGGDWTGPRRAG